MIPSPSSQNSVFSPDGFRQLAVSMLADPPVHPDGPVPTGPSDFDLNPDLAFQEITTRDAAVLVGVVARPEVSLLFTVRTDHLPAHAGQIAFPGGKVEAHDTSPFDTALREAHEEIGLDRNLVEPLGVLDCYRTGTGFCITPVVALVDPGFQLTLDRNEVADTFEVPLPFLMNAGNYQRHTRTFDGRIRHFHAIPFEERFIWGATAGILRNMHARLFAS